MTGSCMENAFAGRLSGSVLNLRQNKLKWIRIKMAWIGCFKHLVQLYNKQNYSGLIAHTAMESKVGLNLRPWQLCVELGMLLAARNGPHSACPAERVQLGSYDSRRFVHFPSPKKTCLWQVLATKPKENSDFISRPTLLGQRFHARSLTSTFPRAACRTTAATGGVLGEHNTCCTLDSKPLCIGSQGPYSSSKKLRELR